MREERIAVFFYCTPNGNEPAREWFKSLGEEDRRAVGQDLARVQWQWPVGMPLCRNLGDGLWEVRTSLAGNREARVAFIVHDDLIVVLHGFIKKGRKTPKADLALAGKRKKEFRSED